MLIVFRNTLHLEYVQSEFNLKLNKEIIEPLGELLLSFRKREQFKVKYYSLVCPLAIFD